MPKSKIEWTDWTLNPVKGRCPVACPYCYARKMYDRFKWNPNIRFEPSVFNSLPKKPCKVFVGSTMELFLFDDWMEFILNRCQDFPNHTFQFLTKQPQNLIKFGPFPDNCWVGVSATIPEQIRLAFKYLHYDVQAKVKFISFEPMLGMILPFREDWFTASGVNWVILGSQTKPYKPPKIKWVEEIVRVADKAEIPVFQKDNLKPLLGDNLRQELPK